MTNRKQSGGVFIQCMSLWKHRGLTPFFGYPFFYRMETLKATVCGLNWLLPVITRCSIYTYTYRSVWSEICQRNTRCAVNTGQAWWKQELKSIDCDQLQLLLLSLSQRVQTHRYYKAGCREGGDAVVTVDCIWWVRMMRVTAFYEFEVMQLTDKKWNMSVKAGIRTRSFYPTEILLSSNRQWGCHKKDPTHQK